MTTAARRAWRSLVYALRALTLSAIVAGCGRNSVDGASRAHGEPSATESAVSSPEAPPALPLTPSAPSADVAVEALGSLKPGDIVFQTSRSAQSAAVQRATRSPLSVDFGSDDGRAGQAEAEFEANWAAGARRDGPALSSTTAPKAPEGR